VDDIEFRQFIDELKDKADLAQIMGETGAEYRIEPRRRGKYLIGAVHDSLCVDPDAQIYTWFSKSGQNKSGAESGDVFAWLERYGKMEFWQAALYLAEKYGVRVPSGGPAAGVEDATRARAFKMRAESFEVAAGWFEKQLWESEALGYARSRGWTDETIKLARLGYSDPTKREDLVGELRMYGVDIDSPDVVLLVGVRGRVKEWCKKQGIEGQENWLEHDRIYGLCDFPRLIYPHMWRGKVVYFSARNLKWDEGKLRGESDKSKKGFNPPRILSGERQRYFNHEYRSGAEMVVVVEGQADAITLGQWGIPAVGLVGLAAEEKLGEVLAKCKYRYVALDNDAKGMEARWRVGELLGPMTRMVSWPGEWQGEAVKDANDWLCAMQGNSQDGQDKTDRQDIVKEKEIVLEHLSGAKTLVEELAEWAGTRKGAEKDEAVRKVFGLIGKMGRMERSQYRTRLAEGMKIGVREFNDILRSAAAEDGEGDGEGKAAEMVETLGGFIDGWLVEYLYDPEKKAGKFAYRSPDGKVDMAESLTIEGIKYIPKYPGSFIQRGACLFASELGVLKGTRELVVMIESFIRRWYLLESKYMYRLIAYYVLMTWVYDSFSALCYLRATGEAGAGKSELMRRIGPICYRYMPASGSTSPSSFFRAIEEYKGTLFIDEADLKDGGDMSNDFVKVLNLGAMKGGHIWRMEETQKDGGGREFEVASFNTFGPKLIAMRKEFRDDAVASRSLTLKLMPREPLELKLAGVPLVVSEQFNREALGIRNMLLRWRLHVWKPEIEMDERDVDLEISARLNQVTMPIKALARGDEELRGEIERFLREYNREIVLSRSMTLAARVVEAMWKIHHYPDLRRMHVQKTEDGDEFMMIGDVRKIANELIDEMNESKGGSDSQSSGDSEERKEWKKKRDELSSRGVGAIIRQELQLRVGNRRGTGFPVYWDEVKMQALAKRYGFNVETLNGRDSQDGQDKLMDGQEHLRGKPMQEAF
jgi:hypothetical protein